MEANTTPARAKGIDSLPDALLRHRVLSERDAAKFIGLSHSRLAAKRHAGALDIPKHVRISEGRVGYIVADILAWLDGLGEANTGGEHHARPDSDVARMTCQLAGSYRPVLTSPQGEARLSPLASLKARCRSRAGTCTPERARPSPPLGALAKDEDSTPIPADFNT